MAIALSGKVDGSLNASFLSTAGALSGLEQKIGTLNAAQQKIGRYKELKSNLSDTGQQYRLAQAEVKRLGEAMAGVSNPTKAMKREFEQAEAKAGKLREKFMQQGQELRSLRGEMDKAGVSVKNLSNLESGLAVRAERAAKTQGQLQRAVAARNAAADRLKWSNLQAEVISSAGIALALRKPIKDAAEFETTMAEIKKVVDFESPEAFKQMGSDLQKLSLKVPMTTKALGEIYAAGGQSGIAQKDLLAFTETAAKMGVAFGVQASQAGDWMAKWRTAFKMNQSQVTVLADQINYLGNNTPAVAVQISGVVSRIGALGSVGNVSAKQIAALGASVIGAGQSEEVASTGIKNFMLALTAGTAATKKQREALAALRIDPEIMAKEMMKDPEKVMLGVLERISKVDVSAQSSLLTQIFGKESVAAIAPLLSNLDNLKQNFAKVNGTEFSGSMQKEFEAIANTATSSMQLASNAAELISRRLGNSLLPAVKDLSMGIVGVAESVAGFIEKYPEFTSILVQSVAALGAFKVGWTVVSILKTILLFPFLQFRVGILSIKAAWVAADGSLLAMIKNTKIAQAVTKAWDVGKLIAHKVATLAAAAASKAWAAAQWLLSTALSAGRALLGVGRLIAHKVATLAVAAASKAWAAAQWLLNAALNANPIGLVVIAIAALAGALVLAYNKVEWFRDGVNTAMATIKGVFISGFEKIASLIDTVGEKWNKFLAFLGVAPKIPVPQAVPAATGMAAASVIPHAAGGIFNRPHIGLIAEAGKAESIIPHNPSGERIWQETGKRAGFSLDKGVSPHGVMPDITVNLTVNASGSGADGDAIGQQVLRTLKAALPRALQDYRDQMSRVEYA